MPNFTKLRLSNVAFLKCSTRGKCNATVNCLRFLNCGRSSFDIAKYNVSAVGLRGLSTEHCEVDENLTEKVARQSSSNNLLSQSVFKERQAFYSEYTAVMGEQYPCVQSQDNVMSIQEFLNKFSRLEAGERRREEEVVLFGRVSNKRRVGKKLVFYKIKRDYKEVQLMGDFEDHHYCNKSSNRLANKWEEFDFFHAGIRRGDILSVTGYPYRTKSGELTLAILQCEILAPCLQSLPDYNSVIDKNLRYRFRHVDLMTSRGAKEVFIIRARIIKFMREYLDQRGFIEVETPTLTPHSGGAAAKPFKTHMASQDTDLYLRIAPELYLKQLVVGGIEKVYELGKCFRNENIDLTHNPEFTMCEFYQAYADYQQLMDETQQILCYIVKNINALKCGVNVDNVDCKITVNVPARGKHEKLIDHVIDFSKPFKRICVVEELERILGQPIPDLSDPSSLQELEKILEFHNLQYPCSSLAATPTRIFEFLVEHFLENECVEPTYLCDFPISCSPLARQHRHKPKVTERFELFIARMELVNAYTELNDPEEQRLRFQRQSIDGTLRKNEDWYCSTLEWGLPPTAGWGMGIDRLVMLLTNKLSIKEVILFPFMK